MSLNWQPVFSTIPSHYVWKHTNTDTFDYITPFALSLAETPVFRRSLHGLTLPPNLKLRYTHLTIYNCSYFLPIYVQKWNLLEVTFKSMWATVNSVCHPNERVTFLMCIFPCIIATTTPVCPELWCHPDLNGIKGRGNDKY
jgi:hypothetical protein